MPSDYANLQTLVEDMFETMYAASGVGLAAPQVGVSLRMFVLCGRLAEDPELKDYESVFVNPSIVSRSKEKSVLEEGCLSIPGVRSNVHRPESVQLTYEDLQGHKHQLRAAGLLARIIQHEYDHLQGVLFIDYLSSLRRRLLRKKLNLASTRPNVPYAVQLPKA